MTTLFKYEDREITDRDFIKGLKDIGVKNGDTIFVHTDVGVFGKLAETNRNKLLESFFEILKESVGEGGTIIIPTFTYSFCEGKDYDPKNSPSTVGIFTEFFRKQEGVIRTNHPIFSVGIWGKNKDSFLNVGTDSFDDNSIFGKLFRANGKLVFLGASFHSCTFLHYIEQKHGVPYRYIKEFQEKIIEGKKAMPKSATYYVRDLDKKVVLETSRLIDHLKNKGMLKVKKVGSGNIMAIKAVDLLEEGQKCLDKDINFFLEP